MNNKEMLGNLIRLVLIMFVALTILPIIVQEIDNVINCNQTNQTNQTNMTYQKPIGPTNSFGGGGAGQFGGYDGKVTHKSWGSDLAVYKTNQSITGVCLKDASPFSVAILELVPYFFVIAIFFVIIGTVFSTIGLQHDI